MTIWRTLLVVLLAANVLFFAWAQGWLGDAWPPPGQSQREPERITTQVRPDHFVLLGPEAAARAAASASRAATLESGTASTPAASAAGGLAEAEAATACLEAGPFTADQLTAANRALTRLGVDVATFADVPVAAPGWMVFAGRFADTAARRTRLQAWQRQGVPTPDLLDAPRDLAPGLVFSRHATRADADAALATLASRHPPVVSVARVVAAPAAAARLSRLRVAAASPALALRLNEAAVAQQVRFTRCAAP